MLQENLKIIEIKDDVKFQYDAFLTSQNASFLQSWGWGQWQEQLGRKAYRYTITGDGGDDSGWLLGAQLIRHNLGLGQYYLYCPYGPVMKSGLQIVGYGLIEKITNQIQTDFPDTMFIRLEPTSQIFFGSQPAFRSRAQGRGATINSQLTQNTQPPNTIVSNLEKTEEAILAGMHSKARYAIRVAEKNGVLIRQIQTDEEATLAAKMMMDTLKRRGLIVQSHVYFERFFHARLGGNLQINFIGAFKENLLLACAVTVDFANTRTYLYGGSSRDNKQFMAPNLLHWEIMKDAKVKGIKTYDWFGAATSSGKKAGFVKFKERFGGVKVEYAGARDFVFQPLKYNLYKAARVVNRLRFKI